MKHRHSSYRPGCETCELDMAYVRALAFRGSRIRQVADLLWRAGKTAELKALVW